MTIPLRTLLGIGAHGLARMLRTCPGKKKKARSMRFEPEYTSRTFKGTKDAELIYGWLAPLQPKEGEKYPLVVCLHGSGGSVSASAVLARKEIREKHPAFVMVPKAEAAPRLGEGGRHASQASRRLATFQRSFRCSLKPSSRS